jgi:diguanylate cyclase (GGDEF)-like protein
MDVERARHLTELERIRSARLEQQNLVLSRLAQEDDLTGLLNRRALESVLQTRFEPDENLAPERGFVCALADLDHFKQVNDQLSHQVGDEVLRRVGSLIRESLRGGDVAARYGGEEFALLVDGADLDAAAEVCERLRQAVESHPWSEIRPDLMVTVSLGATAARPGDTATSLLARTDALLYAAKENGRNRVETG